MPRRKKMPERPKPRDNGLLWFGDVLPCDDELPCDNDVELQRLAAIVTRGDRRIFCFERFCYELRSASHDARVVLSERARNARPHTFATLDALAEKMADARAALENLADDASNALHWEAGERDYAARPETGYLTKSFEARLFASGNIDRVKRALADCERWATEARQTVRLPGRHRPREVIGRRMVARLAELWEEQTGQRPTLTTDRVTQEKSGDFLEFCEAVMVPVWNAAGQNLPSVPNLVQRHLYPQGQNSRE